MEQRNPADVRFWLSRKFWFVAMAIAALTTLAGTKTVVFTPEQILDFLKWVLTIAVGGHVATDVTSLVASRVGRSKSASPRVTYTTAEPARPQERDRAE